jgi:hypothetical protein
MKYNLKWLRAVLDAEDQVSLDYVEKELREMEIERKERPLITHLPTVSIKEILGEEGS